MFLSMLCDIRHIAVELLVVHGISCNRMYAVVVVVEVGNIYCYDCYYGCYCFVIVIAFAVAVAVIAVVGC